MSPMQLHVIKFQIPHIHTHILTSSELTSSALLPLPVAIHVLWLHHLLAHLYDALFSFHLLRCFSSSRPLLCSPSPILTSALNSSQSHPCPSLRSTAFSAAILASDKTGTGRSSSRVDFNGSGLEPVHHSASGQAPGLCLAFASLAWVRNDSVWSDCRFTQDRFSSIA